MTIWRFLLLAAFVSITLAGAVSWGAWNWFRTGESTAPLAWFAGPVAVPVGNAGGPTTRPVIEVQAGSGLATVATRLQRAGLLEHPRVWRLVARLLGHDVQIKAGEYQLDRAQTPSAILDQLVTGGVLQRALVIVEGSTVRDTLARLAVAPRLVQSLDAVATEDLMQALGYPPAHAEGQFFPDTYNYQLGDSDADILRRAHERMRSKLRKIWDGRDADLPYAGPEALLIMASIIEKETGVESDRPQIAQVFIKRLREGMRLQTDPTVIYGLGAAFDGDLRSRDLKTDTPYNTYTRFGLPPTPVSLPGTAALHAAAHPAPGDYLYFVSRGDGSSHFSRTLPEHQAAVRRYQLSGR